MRWKTGAWKVEHGVIRTWIHSQQLLIYSEAKTWRVLLVKGLNKTTAQMKPMWKQNFRHRCNKTTGKMKPMCTPCTTFQEPGAYFFTRTQNKQPVLFNSVKFSRKERVLIFSGALKIRTPRFYKQPESGSKFERIFDLEEKRLFWQIPTRILWVCLVPEKSTVPCLGKQSFVTYCTH